LSKTRRRWNFQLKEDSVPACLSNAKVEVELFELEVVVKTETTAFAADETTRRPSQTGHASAAP
jgi:hypothetical protein